MSTEAPVTDPRSTDDLLGAILEELVRLNETIERVEARMSNPLAFLGRRP